MHFPKVRANSGFTHFNSSGIYKGVVEIMEVLPPNLTCCVPFTSIPSYRWPWMFVFSFLFLSETCECSIASFEAKCRCSDYQCEKVTLGHHSFQNTRALCGWYKTLHFFPSDMPADSACFEQISFTDFQVLVGFFPPSFLLQSDGRCSVAPTNVF